MPAGGSAALPRPRSLGVRSVPEPSARRRRGVSPERGLFHGTRHVAGALHGDDAPLRQDRRKAHPADARRPRREGGGDPGDDHGPRRHAREGRALFTREHDSGDRRMMLVHLTPKGHSALREILPGHFKQMAAQMAPLTEHERKTLVRLLNKVAGLPAAAHIEAHPDLPASPSQPDSETATHLTRQ